MPTRTPAPSLVLSGLLAFALLAGAQITRATPAAVFIVNSTADPGDGTCNGAECTLREAITAANNTPNGSDPDEIHFSIPGAGPHTIQPSSALPTITDPVILNGLTEPGASCDAWPPTLQIEIDGTNAGGFSSGILLGPGAAGSTVRGFVINDFDESGMYVQADNARIECNYIGTNVAGTSVEPHSEPGVTIDDATGVRIGGAAPATRNLISGSDESNILITGAGAAGAVIQGNFIGTDVTGTAALSSSGDSGVEVDEGLGGHLIGGTDHDPGTCNRACNLISGNEFVGIIIDDSGGGNVIQGNFIGTDITGMAALPNGTEGIELDSGGNVVGGTAAGAGNLISANGNEGMAVDSDNNVVQGNLIGTDITGVGDLGNGKLGNPFISYPGVAVTGNGNIIGGTAPGAGNVIAFNDGDGVWVGEIQGDQYDDNVIQGNSIFSNNELGIDLGSDEVTPNDAGDGDVGPNNRQNFPILSSAISSGPNTTVGGTLNSAANTTFRIEFFANDACDPSGHGEGQIYLGFQDVTTDGSGNATLGASFPAGQAPADQHITATATDPSGNTSEFSACRVVIALNLDETLFLPIVIRE